MVPYGFWFFPLFLYRMSFPLPVQALIPAKHPFFWQTHVAGLELLSCPFLPPRKAFQLCISPLCFTYFKALHTFVLRVLMPMCGDGTNCFSYWSLFCNLAKFPYWFWQLCRLHWISDLDTWAYPLHKAFYFYLSNLNVLVPLCVLFQWFWTSIKYWMEAEQTLAFLPELWGKLRVTNNVMVAVGFHINSLS